MNSAEWAKSWQITDGFMRVRMGIWRPIILWTYMATLLLFIRRWKSLSFWFIVAAFGFFVADVVLTANHQI